MTTTAALVAGLATSFHCVGMCGPLACGLGTTAKSESERLFSACIYHALRLFSYGVIGAICGAIGKQPLQYFFDSPASILPWVMVLILLLTGFGVEAHLPRPAFWKRFTARTRFQSSTLSIYGSSAMIGLLTPLLPCSPLYMIFGASMLAGSAAKGAEFTLAFGLGTTPLLWLAQHQFHRLRAKINPRAMLKLRRGLAIITALILAWRLHGTLDFPWLQPDEKPKELPSCCH